MFPEIIGIDGVISWQIHDMTFRNFKMVGYVVYGRGSFNQLDEIIAPHRNLPTGKRG